jgi:hypothetical protein
MTKREKRDWDKWEIHVCKYFSLEFRRILMTTEEE